MKKRKEKDTPPDSIETKREILLRLVSYNKSTGDKRVVTFVELQGAASWVAEEKHFDFDQAAVYWNGRLHHDITAVIKHHSKGRLPPPPPGPEPKRGPKPKKGPKTGR